jgi:hypothetical protein
MDLILLSIPAPGMRRIISAYLFAVTLVTATHSVQAGSATWNANPTDSNWYTADNWTPTTVPNGPGDVATISNTKTSIITLPAFSETVLDSLIFSQDLSHPAFVEIGDQASLTFVGTGLLNDVLGQLVGITVDNTSALTFEGESVAQAYLSNRGQLEFHDHAMSSGGITCYGGEGAQQPGSITTFSENVQLQAGEIIINDGIFGGLPGQVYFTDDTAADQALVLMGGKALLDISGHNLPGLAIKSLSGTGEIFLGANNLTITNEYAAGPPPGTVISDGGTNGGTGGSLTKVGDAGDILSLFGGSSYTGGTIIEGGILFAGATHGSATGTGPVWVKAGSLGGAGNISGSVKVGTGRGKTAILTPGHNDVRPAMKIGTLTIRGSLSCAADAIVQILIDTRTSLAAKVAAAGVTIDPAARIQFLGLHQQPLVPGMTFTIIENNAAAPISGTFVNLPDGGTITVASNTYQANYEGGDGNDLTITVIE